MPLVMIVLLRPLYQPALARRGVQAGTHHGPGGVADHPGLGPFHAAVTLAGRAIVTLAAPGARAPYARPSSGTGSTPAACRRASSR